MIHSWKGSEQRLNHPAIVAHAMTVESFNPEEASGTFTFVDYAEGGIHGDETWEAKYLEDADGNAWTVKCTSETIWQKDGVKFFTLIEDVNRAIRKFVSDKLEIIREHGKLPEPTPITPLKSEVYTGRCICDQLAFEDQNWQVLELIEGHPPRIHECHCGRKWWVSMKEITNSWMEIGDEVLWKDILDHGGDPQGYFGSMDGKLYATQTLRDQGFIPIG